MLVWGGRVCAMVAVVFVLLFAVGKWWVNVAVLSPERKWVALVRDGSLIVGRVTCGPSATFTAHLLSDGRVFFIAEGGAARCSIFAFPRQRSCVIACCSSRSAPAVVRCVVVLAFNRLVRCRRDNRPLDGGAIVVARSSLRGPGRGRRVSSPPLAQA